MTLTVDDVLADRPHSGAAEVASIVNAHAGPRQRRADQRRGRRRPRQAADDRDLPALS